MAVTHGLLKFPAAFDKNVHSRLPSLTTLSTGFLVKPYKATQGFRLVQTSKYLTSLTPTAAPPRLALLQDVLRAS